MFELVQTSLNELDPVQVNIRCEQAQNVFRAPRCAIAKNIGKTQATAGFPERVHATSLYAIHVFTGPR